jgi:hypothetical protein
MITVSTGGRPYTFDVMEMLELRAKGWTYSELGRKYGKDHTTIMHSCKKFGVVPNQPVPAQRIPKVPSDPFQEEERPMKKKKKIQDKYAYIFDEPVNPGKTYAQYMADARKRPAERQYMETWGSEPNWTGIYAGGKKTDGPSLRDLKSMEEEI